MRRDGERREGREGERGERGEGEKREREIVKERDCDNILNKDITGSNNMNTHFRSSVAMLIGNFPSQLQILSC